LIPLDLSERHNSNVNQIFCLLFQKGNLIFTRDQQITTKSGLVLGRLCSPQRDGEVAVMKFVFDKLGVPIIGQIEEPGTLEGKKELRFFRLSVTV
jgi:arginine deiminase